MKPQLSYRQTWEVVEKLVYQWRTDACRRMVSRNPGPKFMKFGE